MTCNLSKLGPNLICFPASIHVAHWSWWKVRKSWRSWIQYCLTTGPVFFRPFVVILKNYHFAPYLYDANNKNLHCIKENLSFTSIDCKTYENHAEKAANHWSPPTFYHPLLSINLNFTILLTRVNPVWGKIAGFP